MSRLVLASTSGTRQRLLTNAGIEFDVEPARIDEPAVRDALAAEGVAPRDVADALAGQKALKVSARHPDALVIGCDQILDHRGDIISKPRDRDEALKHLRRLCGDRHALQTAAVVAEGGQAIWRHVATVRLHMRAATDTWLDDYVGRNWEQIRHSAGGYLIEGEGVRLFDRIDGDMFAIMGLPLVPLLSWLTLRGTLAG